MRVCVPPFVFCCIIEAEHETISLFFQQICEAFNICEVCGLVRIYDFIGRVMGLQLTFIYDVGNEGD